MAISTIVLAVIDVFEGNGEKGGSASMPGEEKYFFQKMAR